jgi:DNA processing protein
MSAISEVDLGRLLTIACIDGVGAAGLLALRHSTDLERAWAQMAAGGAESVPELAGTFRATKIKDRPTLVAGIRDGVRGADPEALLAAHRRGGRQILVHGTSGYPARLAEDPAPPALLFARGDLSVLDRPTVAIVGTRNATRAGRELAFEWARQLASAGVGVVSGLALGIDGAAHQGALAALAQPSPPPSAPLTPTGRPVGVVAAGLDIAYPRRHDVLQRQVEGTGLLLSETPLGIHPSRWRFPARNRVIAGVADAVVVVESRSVGGSMLTAGEALTRDCPVLAVPGHPTAPAAAGTNDLIADGAAVARDVDDVLVAIGLGGILDPPSRAEREATGTAALGREERAVLEVIGEQAVSLDEVISRTELGLDEASAALGKLEAAGRVSRTGSWFERANRSAARALTPEWGR